MKRKLIFLLLTIFNFSTDVLSGEILTVQEAYIKASNSDGGSAGGGFSPSGDEFGNSIDLDENTLVVGAPIEDSIAIGINGDQVNNDAPVSGAVYVFVRDELEWTQQAYIKASNTSAYDLFGRTVAIHGDTIVVGATREDSDGLGVYAEQNDAGFDTGAAYIFERTGSNWVETAFIKPEEFIQNGYFGEAVEIYEDTVIVAGKIRDPNFFNTTYAALFVYDKQNGQWQLSNILNTEVLFEYFPFNQEKNISLYENTLAVGAVAADDGYQLITPNTQGADFGYRGVVYLIEREGNNWINKYSVTASNRDEDDYFGASVALHNNTLVVGAPYERSRSRQNGIGQQDNTGSFNGAAYVFSKENGEWQQKAYFKGSNTEEEDFFGTGTAVFGDRIAISATGDDSLEAIIENPDKDNPFCNASAVYLFEARNGSWTETDYLKSSNIECSDGYGISLAMSGDLIAVGASGEDSDANGINGNGLDNSALGAGAVYIVNGNFRFVSVDMFSIFSFIIFSILILSFGITTMYKIRTDK